MLRLKKIRLHRSSQTFSIPFFLAACDDNTNDSRHSDTDRQNKHGSDHSTELLPCACGHFRWPVRWYVNIPLFKHTVDEVCVVKQAAAINKEVWRQTNTSAEENTWRMYIDVGHNKPVKQTTRGFEINLIPMSRRSYWHPLEYWWVCGG